MPDDALRPLISTIRRVYYTVRKREPIAAVLDTMDALGFETRFALLLTLLFRGEPDPRHPPPLHPFASVQLNPC